MGVAVAGHRRGAFFATGLSPARRARSPRAATRGTARSSARWPNAADTRGSSCARSARRRRTGAQQAVAHVVAEQRRARERDALAFDGGLQQVRGVVERSGRASGSGHGRPAAANHGCQNSSSERSSVWRARSAGRFGNLPPSSRGLHTGRNALVEQVLAGDAGPAAEAVADRRTSASSRWKSTLSALARTSRSTSGSRR